MTIETFKYSIKKGNRFNDFLNYFISLTILFFGLYLLIRILYGSFHSSTSAGTLLRLIVSTSFCLMGLYGFWRIPKDYKITQIPSLKKTDEKWEIIDEYLSQQKIVTKSKRTNFIECRYRNNFFNLVDLSIYFDDEIFLFNTHSVNLTSFGFIDFGLTKRSTQKLKKHIQACL